MGENIEWRRNWLMRRRSKWISLFAAVTILVFMMLMQAGVASAAPFGNPYDQHGRWGYDQHGRWGYDQHGRWGYYYNNTSPTNSNSLSAPVISPSGGAFTSAQTVTISDISSGDTAYYTTDGSNPESSNTAVAYSGSFTVSQSETVLAAIHDPTNGWSSVASAAFDINGSSSLQAPVISPGGGDYSSAQSVTIGDIYGTTYYTTDGSNPETSNTRITYGGPFTVSQSATIQAVNESSAGWSSVTSATFDISGSSSLQAPVISPGGGDYSSAQSVTIGDIYGTTYYTTDGSNPEGSSTAITYGGPFTVSQSATIQAVNESSAGWSSVTSATFDISGSSTTQTGANSEQIDQLKQEILVAINGNNWSNAEGILKQIIKLQQSDWAFTQLGQIYQQQGNSSVSVFSNGSQLNFDVQPVIVNGRTLVPIRSIANALGISDNNVSYSSGAATINDGSNQMVIPSNAQQVYLNGKSYAIDSSTEIVNGRMMVPLRAISQLFNKNVQWYPNGRIVSISQADQ
jgi:hypothetical protein